MLELAGTPFVLVNRSLEDGSVPAVTVNDRQGIALAVEHVVALGHERVGHVAGPQNLSTGHRRHAGAEDLAVARERHPPPVRRQLGVRA